jgi:hypothetical protein
MLQSALQRLTAAPGVPADAYVPQLAPLVVLAFLGAGFVLAVSGVGAAVAFAAGRARLARLLAGAALTVASGYCVALVAASLLSRERTLAAGEKKYFCEMDCHLAYSVSRTAREDGRRVVSLRTWFDPSTIASFRGNAPLTPNPREVWLEVGGRRVAPSPEATRAWREGHGERRTLSDALRPGESYETTFVFDAPNGPGPARLFVGDPEGLEALLIGHENSPLHRRVFFEIPDPQASAPAPCGDASERFGRRAEAVLPPVDRGRRS